MVVRKDNHQDFVIGKSGMYKVTARYCFNSSCGGHGHWIQINKNGSALASQYGSRDAEGFISEIFRFQKDEKIAIRCCCSGSSDHTTKPKYNCFMLEKL